MTIKRIDLVGGLGPEPYLNTIKGSLMFSKALIHP